MGGDRPAPLPIERVTAGMTVLDAAGVELGRVAAVQPPDTDIRPDLPAGPAEFYMDTGYFLIDGGEPLTNDVYVGGHQIRRVAGRGDGAVVTLTVTYDELDRSLD